MTIGQELVAFIRAETARGVKRVRIHAGPEWCSRCFADRDLPYHSYCKECRRKARQERQNTSAIQIMFHTEAFQGGLKLLRDE